MTRSTREAFQRGTDTFNAHDLEGFAGVLADDVVFAAPGISGKGKAACVEFFGGIFLALGLGSRMTGLVLTVNLTMAYVIGDREAMLSFFSTTSSWPIRIT